MQYGCDIFQMFDISSHEFLPQRQHHTMAYILAYLSSYLYMACVCSYLKYEYFLNFFLFYIININKYYYYYYFAFISPHAYIHRLLTLYTLDSGYVWSFRANALYLIHILPLKTEHLYSWYRCRVRAEFLRTTNDDERRHSVVGTVLCHANIEKSCFSTKVHFL